MTSPDKPEDVIFLMVKMNLNRIRKDYSPFISFQDAMCLLARAFYKWADREKSCRDILITLSEFLFVFPGSAESDFESIPSTVNAIHSIISECSREFEKRGYNFSLTPVTAIDYGTSRNLSLSAPAGNRVYSTWTGLYRDRLHKLTDAMTGNALPSLLITHSFYTRLNEPMKSAFPTAYYIQHICCYGKE